MAPVDETPDPEAAAIEAWRSAEPLAVSCESCGHATTIMPHPVEGHEQRWKCDCRAERRLVSKDPDVWESTKPDVDGDCDCDRANVIPGAPGVPGEGALNPAASAVGHDDLVEAATRRLSDTELLDAVKGRGIEHKLVLGGDGEPAGEVTT